MISTEVSYKMDTKFMNLGNSKISVPQRLLLNLSYKIKLKKE